MIAAHLIAAALLETEADSAKDWLMSQPGPLGWAGLTFGAPGQPMGNVGRKEVVLLVKAPDRLAWFVWDRFSREWEARGHFESLKMLPKALASLRDVKEVWTDEELEVHRKFLLAQAWGSASGR